jgi:hypothetical protein
MSCTGRETAPLATLTSGLVATATPWPIKAVALTISNKANASLDIPKLENICQPHSLFVGFISSKIVLGERRKQPPTANATPPGQSWMTVAQNNPAQNSTQFAL